MKKILLILIITINSFFNCYSQQDTTKSPIDLRENTIEFKHLEHSILRGVDVSFYQGNINWDTIAKYYQFAIIKATEGDYLVDKKFNYNWNNSKGKVIRGAYHYFRPTFNGVEQAKLFLSTVKFEKGDILPVIDVEYVYAYRRYGSLIGYKNLILMINYIEKELKVKPIIYTSYNFWNKYMSKHFKGKEAEHILWLAFYTYDINRTPIVPGNFEKWHFWQYSDKGKVKHHNSYFDENIFNGHHLGEVIFKQNP